MAVKTTFGDATVYSGDFGGRAQGNWDGKSWGTQTATGLDMEKFPMSVAMHDQNLKYHIIRVTSHDTGKSRFVFSSNIMGNPDSPGDLTPVLAKDLGHKVVSEKYHDKQLNRDFDWVKSEDANNVSFEVVGEMKVKQYNNEKDAGVLANKLNLITEKMRDGGTAEDLAKLNEDPEFSSIAEIYPEFIQQVEANGNNLAYMPAKEATSNGLYAKHKNTSGRPNEQEMRTRLASGFKNDPNEDEETHNKRLNSHMKNTFASMPQEEQAMFVFFAIIIGLVTGKDVASIFNNLDKSSQDTPDYNGSYGRYANAARSGNFGPKEARVAVYGDGENDNVANYTPSATSKPIPDFQTSKIDLNNYSIEYNGNKIDIVKNGKLQDLSVQEQGVYILYVGDKARKAREGMEGSKVGMTFDISHYAKGFEGARTASGVSETTMAAFAADIGIDRCKESGIKPHLLQENPRVVSMIRNSISTGQLPEYKGNYNMSLRGNVADSNAALYPSGNHVTVSNHFDGPEGGGGQKLTHAVGAFGQINSNPVSATYGKFILSEVSARGAVSDTHRGLITSHRGMQGSCDSPCVLMENGSGYNAKEAAALSSSVGVKQQVDAVFNGVVKANLARGNALYNSEVVVAAAEELKDAKINVKPEQIIDRNSNIATGKKDKEPSETTAIQYNQAAIDQYLKDNGLKPSGSVDSVAAEKIADTRPVDTSKVLS